VSQTFKFGKAALTVRANDAERPFGSSALPCTVTFVGLVNGNPPSVVSGSPTCTTTATASSPNGTYPLTPSLGTLSAANYTFGPFVNGTLTILQMGTTVGAVRGDTTYGDATATLTATLQRVGDNSPLAGATIRFTLGGTYVGTATTNGNGVASLAGVAVTHRNAGSYAGLVGASFAGNGSNLASSGTGPLVVARKVLWIKPTDRTVGLKQPNPSTTPPAGCLAQQTSTSACWLQLANGSTFANGDTWSSLNMTALRFSYGRNPQANSTEQVGQTYRITVFGVVSSNYDIRYALGTLTVISAP
jgi:hypothetical protein